MIRLYAEGNTKAAIARIVKVSPSTVARWIRKGAEHARLFHDVHASLDEAVEMQLDELRSNGRGRARRAWVFSGLEVSTRMWMGLRVGSRTKRTTQVFVRELSDLLGAASAWTVWSTDCFRYYAPVLKKTFAGRPAVHIEVKNNYVRGEIARTASRKRLGSDWAYAEALERNEDSNRPNTSFIERMNLHTRMRCALLRRRTPAPARSCRSIQEALEIVRLDYNFVQPHGSLSHPRRKKTPAMAAGITKRPLRIREIFSWVVPPDEARRRERKALFARATW